MRGARVFFDTNVLLYLLSSEVFKADRAEGWLAQGGILSVQVLNEFASVASRKLGMSWAEIGECLSAIRSACTTIPLTVEIHEQALTFAERAKLSFYDALIVAAALSAGCTILLSEDLQTGRTIGALTIRNPFE